MDCTKQKTFPKSTFLQNCLLSNSTLHWSYLQEGLFSLQPYFSFKFRKPLLTGHLTSLPMFPKRQQQPQYFFKQAVLFFVSFSKLLKHKEWNLSSANNPTACFDHGRLCIKIQKEANNMAGERDQTQMQGISSFHDTEANEFINILRKRRIYQYIGSDQKDQCGRMAIQEV